MLNEFTTVRGDRLPHLRGQLRQANGKPIDLTRATSVVWEMVPAVGGEAVSGACVVENAILGMVRYEWQVEDVAVAGVYKGVWRAYFDTGESLTIPSEGHVNVVIAPRITD